MGGGSGLKKNPKGGLIGRTIKTIGNDRAVGENFISWCAEFAKVNNMEITVTISDDPALASDEVKQYL